MGEKSTKMDARSFINIWQTAHRGHQDICRGFDINLKCHLVVRYTVAGITLDKSEVGEGLLDWHWSPRMDGDHSIRYNVTQKSAFITYTKIMKWSVSQDWRLQTLEFGWDKACTHFINFRHIVFRTHDHLIGLNHLIPRPSWVNARNSRSLIYNI